VTTSSPRWIVEDKYRLLVAVISELADTGHISLEGSLSVFNLATLPGASNSETNVLKRNTIWPKQDFLVFPIEPPITDALFKRLGYRVPKRIIHIQIEKNGILEFGAYDTFHPDCISWGPTLKGPFVESLLAQGILSRSSQSK
jgi:hypothetical protein